MQSDPPVFGGAAPIVAIDVSANDVLKGYTPEQLQQYGKQIIRPSGEPVTEPVRFIREGTMVADTAFGSDPVIWRPDPYNPNGRDGRAPAIRGKPHGT